MRINDIKQELEKHDLEYHGTCHDCGAPVTVLIKVTEEGSIEVAGGAIYKRKEWNQDRLYFKCDKCYRKDTTLRNFIECEVYSRVVGYLRPVQQWNKGKKEEYEMRKEFKQSLKSDNQK